MRFCDGPLKGLEEFGPYAETLQGMVTHGCASLHGKFISGLIFIEALVGT